MIVLSRDNFKLETHAVKDSIGRSSFLCLKFDFVKIIMDTFSL